MRLHYSSAIVIRTDLIFSFVSSIVVNVNIVSFPKFIHEDDFTIWSFHLCDWTVPTITCKMTIGESDEYILLKMDISISPSYVTSDKKFSDTVVTYHNVLYIIVRRIQPCQKTSFRSSSYARRHFRIFLYPVRLSRTAWKTHVRMLTVKNSIRTLPSRPPE